MKIFIVGAGFTGIQLARRLLNEQNDVVLIDNNEETVRVASNRLDCDIKFMDGNSLQNLEDAGIAKANALVCVTNSDEVNMITCSLVDAVYPDILKIARVRNFSYYSNRDNVTKTHADTFSGKHRPLYGIDFMIHPDVEAANAIVRAVESGAVSDVVAFENSEFELTRMTIQKGSTLSGQKLMNVRSLTEKPFIVAYVESEGKTSLPSGQTELKEGDSIGVLTMKGDVADLLLLCGSQLDHLRKIAIVGAGKIGTLVADNLIAKQSNSIFAKLFGKRKKTATEFAIIDLDSQLTKEAADRYPTAHIFHGDVTDEAFLEEEGITSYDLVICATHNHELNMVVAAYIESRGVEKTISLVESASLAEIARKLGIDVPVPLRDTIVDSILSHLRGKTVTGIHTVSSGDLEIIECTIPISSQIAGKTLLDISDPGSFLVLLVNKAGSTNCIIPIGSTVLDVNDSVILITQSEKTKDILELFGGQ